MPSAKMRLAYSVISVLFIWLSFFDHVKASYAVPASYYSGISPRANLAYFVRNNKLYNYGGQVPTNYTSDIFTSLSLSQSDDPNIKGTMELETVPQALPGSKNSFSRATLLPDGNRAIVFTGSDDAQLEYNETIYSYIYNFNSPNASWVRFPAPSNATGPMLRTDFSATLAPNGKIYIYGGTTLILDASYNDIWSFEPSTGVYTDLTTPDARYVFGHSAIALPDGRIVFLFGGVSETNISETIAVSSKDITIFDTKTNSWSNITATGPPISDRIAASAILAADKKSIIVYAGNNGKNLLTVQSYNDVLVLDTTTWIWTIPEVAGPASIRRSRGSIGLVSDNVVIMAYGGELNDFSSNIDVLRFNSQTMTDFVWVANKAQYNDPSIKDGEENVFTGLSGGAIAGIVIGVLVFVIVVLMIVFKLWRPVLSFISYIHSDIVWRPRSGEPLWTETCRLVCRFIILLIFFAFFSFTIWQVVRSPISTITIRTAAAAVQTPDIRICFEGWNNAEGAYAADENGVAVRCNTDTGDVCNDYVTLLDMSISEPRFSDSIGNVTCFLYAPPDSFRLVKTLDGSTNGTQLTFSLFGDGTVQGAIHANIYPPGMDPNVATYNINTTNVAQLYSPADLAEWQRADMDDKKAENVYDIEPSTYSTIGYNLQNHRYLQNNGWNNVGFLPVLNDTPEITTIYRSGVHNLAFTTQTPSMIGRIVVFPNDFDEVVLKEQKVYSLLNALGFVGGVFSLLIAVQAWLFGFRPNSPWGVIHRWSVGSMKQSIKRRLRTQFSSLHTPIPLINPVHRRFSTFNLPNYHNPNDDPLYLDQDELDQDYRLGRMEERMQLMELLFKSYYINDEIFKELDLAIKQEDNNISIPSKNDLTPTDSDRMPMAMRNRRPSSPIMPEEFQAQGPQSSLSSSVQPHHSRPPISNAFTDGSTGTGLTPGSQQRLLGTNNNNNNDQRL
ncbi:hypothetical protein J3Q64DRAFT_1708896 [Phycomyces blakesleeanus]|uniref:Attractin/MKLN-like beta-propeller domain-containing protein n=2 Tax=Phycomyces blakesleeanus TaxID=4837 RepID=A0A163D267_PHYB8|nr:hypothetical protein PHYBLDRAFT_79418 [Phycomyces blakesleeanus NRRL 1555(-)]OAD68180.1 hypothetical protein PHYBLDRAFT_79418 [Phycomyces blakesleeanus NRRL 1555(-)]|eukprot:XP_018286220.1 hypothetical protein PHYBLDRAFT_79418 [Phycomyces blakesleeanus NRRL 1555(-)]